MVCLSLSLVVRIFFTRTALPGRVFVREANTFHPDSIAGPMGGVRVLVLFSFVFLSFCCFVFLSCLVLFAKIFHPNSIAGRSARVGAVQFWAQEQVELEVSNYYQNPNKIQNCHLNERGKVEEETVGNETNIILKRKFSWNSVWGNYKGFKR